MIVDCVREHAGRRDPGGLRWGVEPICTVLTEHGLPIAPSTYYAQVNKLPTAREYRDALLINEIATRPHNSGHWTIEGAATSQFEQHLRAVLDLPLGSVARTAPVVVTANVLGPRDGSDPATRLAAALTVPGVHVHLYGKVARPGRKLGHVTCLGDDRAEVRARALQAVALLTGEAREGTTR